jgi:hypothetical protein
MQKKFKAFKAAAESSCGSISTRELQMKRIDAGRSPHQNVDAV